MKRLVVIISILVTVLAASYVYVSSEMIGFVPEAGDLVNTERMDNRGYDLWGERLTKDEVQQLGVAANEAVEINQDLIELGRENFYKGTFGNEVFLTDVMGIVDGPFSVWGMVKAILKLKGKGTSNLKVELTKDAVVGGQTFKKGQVISTGIDVAKGSYLPIGLPITVSDGSVKVGISCAACHATVDPVTKKVLEGVPNQDLEGGLLLALASNSTAFFTHGEIKSIESFLTNEGQGKLALPNPVELERALDSTFLKWPKGSFDSTVDMKANPAQIPDSFTHAAHPYGWSGYALAGPFNGLSVFNNNVHAQNTDSTAQQQVSMALFGMDEDTYLGTILQNAADKKFRYSNQNKEKPTDFFKKIDPTPDVPGMLELVKPPTYPKMTPMVPDGLVIGSAGFKYNEQIHSMSAFQDQFLPAKPRIEVTDEEVSSGRRVFERAGCISCHAGPSLTNHTIIPIDKIRTNSSRATALAKTANLFGEPKIYSHQTELPIKESENPKVVEVPLNELEAQQIPIAFGHDGKGGYKVKGLVGLYWTAPYLHDGGVAVGKLATATEELGLTGTLKQGKPVDPYNSLKALVDRELRVKVIRANEPYFEVNVTGEGHEFWVDPEAGFTEEEQHLLIQYLLSIDRPK
jgi:hypothetical protein